jgi:hypothetical protein
VRQFEEAFSKTKAKSILRIRSMQASIFNREKNGEDSERFFLILFENLPIPCQWCSALGRSYSQHPELVWSFGVFRGFFR